MGPRHTPSKPVNAPRPCPYCQTPTPGTRDYRFLTQVWRWDCNEHGFFAFVISLR